MTQAGLDKLKKELADALAQRPVISAAIAEAREKGDLSENAEYDAVVVGFGGAGAIAAIDMADAGLDVPEIFLWAAAITLSGLMQYRKLRKAVITVFRL